MNRLALGDRLRTIAVTVILTSIGWLAFGGSLIESIGNLAVLRNVDTPESTPAANAPAAVAPAPAIEAQTAPSARSEDYVLPVTGVRADQLSDTFSEARGSGTRIHDAIDIMAPRGTPVVAAAAGTVEKLFTSKAGGLTIYVRSPDRQTITYYAHLDAYAPGLSEGIQVQRGQKIGTVGFSGNADPTAPHLHFAIMQTTPDNAWWEPATAINPYPILTGRAP